MKKGMNMFLQQNTLGEVGKIHRDMKSAKRL